MILAIVLSVGIVTRSSVNAADPQEVNPPTSEEEARALAISASGRQIREFIRAQKAELQDLDRKNKVELKELKVAQDTHRKNWLKAEQTARHEFFAANSNGAERRPYIKDFLKRKADLNGLFVDEKKQRVAEQEEKMKTLKQTQVVNLQKFTDAVEHGQEPSKDLWPKTN